MLQIIISNVKPLNAAMEKHISIKRVLERLKLLVDFTKIEVVDYWEADLCAIGLKKDNLVVYISTFGYLANEMPGLDFDLEVMQEDESFRVIKSGINVSEKELADEVNMFFFGP